MTKLIFGVVLTEEIVNRVEGECDHFGIVISEFEDYVSLGELNKSIADAMVSDLIAEYETLKDEYIPESLRSTLPEPEFVLVEFAGY